MKNHIAALSVSLCLILAGCAKKESDKSSGASSGKSEIKIALESISGDEILKRIKVLASDEFEGRGPGTKGEELTVNYLINECKRIGLKPGNPNGTYVQEVPLVGFTGQPTALFSSGTRKMSLKSTEEYVAVSRRFIPEIKVETSDVVFVGYGVVAPEYGWDDYKGLDVKGKTIVMLINDPAVPDPQDPSKLDEKMFKGKAMTYYGRWTYKYEIASEKGAAAAIIIHETGPAGYPYEVVSGSWGRENFDIQKANKNMHRVAVESWLRYDKAKELFAMGGQDLEALKKAALTKDFKPVALNVKANFAIKNTLREVQSKNVIGRLDGSDPQLKNEYIIYTAHWDHLGRDPKLQGDQIFNGAIDNASGTASVMELGSAFTKLTKAPRRSILFLFVTAEEKGLLGAKYYAENPLYPLNKTVADINIDAIYPWGRTKDIEIVGWGNSTLDDVTQEIAQAEGRAVKPDTYPEKGYFYRSDHFEFAKQGVPALDPKSGNDYIGKPADYGRMKHDEYTQKDYHKVSDEVKPDWDMSGIVDDLKLLFQVGYRVAESDKYPEWKTGTEFKQKREETLRKAN